MCGGLGLREGGYRSVVGTGDGDDELVGSRCTVVVYGIEIDRDGFCLTSSQVLISAIGWIKAPGAIEVDR